MRDHIRCRSHRGSSSVEVRRDAEPGSRSVGAPDGNLNALKHGRYSNPLSESDLERLVVVATQSQRSADPERRVRSTAGPEFAKHPECRSEDGRGGSEGLGPDDLAYHIALLVRAIQDRIGDPSSEAEIPGIRNFRTLLVVNRVLTKLIDRLASTLLRTEIAETLSALPPGVRERVQAELETLTSRTSPTRALALFEKVRKERKQKKTPEKQSPEPGLDIQEIPSSIV
jgi:hypothetical protein